MEWEGVDQFLAFLNAAPGNLRRLAGAHAAASAHYMRDQAMANMGGMRIGLVTGRSRALYGVRVEPAAYDPRASGSVAAYAGYLAWPSDVVFYPRFLNDGTSRMAARPYHDLAFDQTRPFFEQGMRRALNRAMQGAS
ncbi:hypothetical protein [Paracoccus versutus]|uniref:HK97 gp10 family phage protein n=1 Tax=Paracoccus versutus TaxID=34007 RepID=A0A3D9XGL4_PARVE|nr:hypothetical protein [Paracoccus versutus]REF69646.1 hypothetical protein BDD41_2356 [Paracoccus versutus]WGR57982.1 hypothetical protein E3U25_18765 [Paracoccus versutus]